MKPAELIAAGRQFAEILRQTNPPMAELVWKLCDEADLLDRLVFHGEADHAQVGPQQVEWTLTWYSDYGLERSDNVRQAIQEMVEDE